MKDKPKGGMVDLKCPHCHHTESYTLRYLEGEKWILICPMCDEEFNAREAVYVA